MNYNYGNLAYKLPQDYDEAPARKPKRRKRVKIDRRKREQMLIRNKIIRRIGVIAVIALSAGFMISQFVAVNETEQKIASLEKKLAAAESVTSQMIFDMEQSVDLAEVEKQATTRLGMQRPEKYQTIYVNVKQNDMTEKTAGEVEGVGNRLISALKKTGSHIVNFFSIK